MGSSAPLQGKLEGVIDSALVITLPAGKQSLPRTEIHSVSVRKKGHRLRNTFIGLGVGAGAGLGIGAAATNGCDEFLCGIVIAAAAGIGAVAGTVIGVVWPTGGWRKVYAR